MSGIDDDLEGRVRRRAYELWEAAGRPEGQGDEFWHDAWNEVTAEGKAFLESEPNKSAAKPKVQSPQERSTGPVDRQ